MTQQKNPRKENGHPGPNGRPNGHGPAYAPAHLAGGEGGGTPAQACTDRHRSHAASDDAGRDTAALAAACSATNLQTQADTDCQACAAAAPPLPNDPVATRGPGGNRAGAKDGVKDDDPEAPLPPGEYPLPDNPAEFVEEVHRKTDLIEVWHRLLRSKDEKVRQRAIEKLTGMLYEDGALSADDPQPFIFDLPRPKRD
ncbi:MAG TPA: hypothetical protein VJN89_18510 [Candidatus Acidoferrum sp.]|nr:hypothetical protein [Candidatus Acidoferrum sp.]